ncbi:DUF4595 domain-containing protein [Aequorivita antarctica]|uniref:DUF4595 domain-containing protein n=1 Tax=Aequorivita antarctica TaxID=153266 RepID=A0A5C6Z414_9FLAO|nr:DUF4595 domain-containing protein [Aequorivita antarctica]TXD74266.1 DUF4595 domain-containing protein [Aequorivita antarctica]SRX73607.1 hypothetical protein AEQU3_01039 [Aequorivita antarctica]
MKNNRFLLTALLISILSISCSSDDDNSDEPLETRKYVKTEKVSENLKIDYEYNIENILTKAKGNYPNFGYESTFTYTGNYLTKWKEVETGQFPSNSEQNFTYDAQGRLSKYIGPSEDVTLTYSANKVTLTGTIEGDANATVQLELNSDGLITKFTEANQYTIFQYDNIGNMVSAESFDNNSDPIAAFTITYDAKINPFYGQFRSIYIERFIEFFWEFDGIYVSGMEGYSFPFQKNNITAIKENTIAVASYVYMYDAEGYPTDVNEEYYGDPSQYTLEYTR